MVFGSGPQALFRGRVLGFDERAALVWGRSQNLSNGWYVGAPVAPGTTPTTVSNWANGLAFGITYRIPLS